MRKLHFFAILAIGLSIATFYFYHQTTKITKEKKILSETNQELVGELLALDKLKKALKSEVDSLVLSYGKAVEEKELLEKLLKNTTRKLAKTTANYQQFKMESTDAIQSLQEGIQRLVKAKSTLEVTIKETNKSNDILLKQAGLDRKTFTKILNESPDSDLAFKQLKKEYEYVKDRRLAAATEARLKKIKANQKPKAIERKRLRASAFRTETEMKNGKLTVKAKRIKKIVISFDLHNVPAEQLGDQELHLVIKDDKNKLLKKDAATVKVRLKGLLQEIRVVKTKKVTLEAAQRVYFRLDISDKLAAGYHKVEVYAKSGLLGKTSFRIEK